MSGKITEIILNGIIEEETDRYYHICFFGDRERENRDILENYIFVPKPVCRIVDRSTVAIQDWYVKKNKLGKFMKTYDAASIRVDMNTVRLKRLPVIRRR